MTTELNKFDDRLKAIQFLSKAMDCKSLRFHIKHFRVENGRAVSTDGHRLHHVDYVALEDGFYKIHKCTKTTALIDKVYELDNDEGSFPDYADLLVLPEFKVFDLMFSAEKLSASYTRVIRAMESTTLEFNYVKDLLVMDGVVTIHIAEPESNIHNSSEPDETCQPVHFVLGGLHAIIMPKSI